MPSAEAVQSGETGTIEGVYVRVSPSKNSVMGPKEEFIECSTLILANNYQCDVDIFNAVNEAGLIYDGGVVVDQVRDI